jgi:ABC-2 type transport system ATP-binding protein
MNGEIIGKRKYIRDFSTGNQQKIGIIGAIISKPEILFLDEPFNF